MKKSLILSLFVLCTLASCGGATASSADDASSGTSSSVADTTSSTGVSSSGTDDRPSLPSGGGEGPGGSGDHGGPGGSGNSGGPGGNPGGGSSSSVTYTGATEITTAQTITSGSYSSSTADENALLVSGDIDVSMSGITVTKTGDSDSGDNCNFYGINSALIAKDGVNLTLSNINVTAKAKGANGVFSYGGYATTNNSSTDGTTVNISDSTIVTTGDNAGGIMTTGGGITKATNLTVTTSGTSSAPIRTDRGGGTVTVDGGTYTSNGAGSPAIYSTASVTASNATLIANASEGVVIEGKNSVELNNCVLQDDNTTLNGQSTTYKNVFLYQSNSGDAATGNSSFTANDCTIETEKGDSFYVTNASAEITLSGNTITNTDSTGYFLRAQADSWGTSGSNGGDVVLNLSDQDVEGDIAIDSISTLEFNLSSGSSFVGQINGENEAEEIDLVLDSSSTLSLTGDCYVTKLSNADSSNSNITLNGHKLYVSGTAI